MTWLTDVLQQYDDSVDAVAHSTHNFYQDNLARLFSLIDETPEFAAVVRKLEALNDFDAWYDDLTNRGRSHGLGAPQLNLPSDRDAALGMQISLFRRMAKGTIKPVLFAHAYISSNNNVNENLRELTRQLFYPMARRLKGHLVSAIPPPPKELVSLKPWWMGMSIDLKELWRRVTARH
jgi:hypothetical protein